MVEELGITVIPVPFEYSGREFLDGENITPAEFYGMLSTALPPAQTSAPSPGTYMEAFERLSGEGYEVLCVSPTPEVTRMHETAEHAKQMSVEEGVEGRIEVFDSGTATMAQGFMVLEAARMAREGGRMDEVLERLRRMWGSVYLLVTLDTVEYLAKTSRIPRVGALFGKALQIKPIIAFGQGSVEPLENPRTRKKSINRLLELMERHLDGEGRLHVCVQHAGAPEESERLRQSVSERFSPEELFVSEFSPVMGSYTGPGLLGLAFYEG
jgi:DegV family protein with EDD domain